jgi:predicted S18 family serine protease
VARFQLKMALALSIATSDRPDTLVGGAILPNALNVSVAGSVDGCSAALRL